VTRQHDELLSVADVARLLGVNERDVHRIPVPRYGYEGIPGAIYHRSEVEAWRDLDLVSPNSLLKQLRVKKEDAHLRQLQSEIQHTKKGKRKKRFRDEVRQPAYQHCPHCGSPFHSEKRKVEVDDYDEEDNGHAGSWQAAAARGNRARNVTVEYKGRKKDITHHVQPDVEQTHKNAEAAASISMQPKIESYTLLTCTNQKCGYRVEIDQLKYEVSIYELFDPGEEDVDERSVQAAIGEVNGDLPENDGNE
jgi:hypothetical protein